MSVSDPLGDMLTRIRNGQRVGKSTVCCPASTFRANVLGVLEREGFIRGYSWAELGSGIQELTIELKYADGEPVIREINRVSRPGRSEEHTSELQSIMRISYAVFCLKNKKNYTLPHTNM